jgi:alpha-L-fucosidase
MTTSEWFAKARFGLFVHWGHYAAQGIEASWPMVGGVFAVPEAGVVDVATYQSTAKTFDPKSYDPVAWAKRAKAAGMQYAVFTTKHHDGFAMFDTKTSTHGIMHGPHGRDLFRAFADAMRAEGIKVGVYFSLPDWTHPDYPAFTQEDVPYQFPRGKKLDPATWPRFTDAMLEQLRELLTNYGRIDVLWFDGGWERKADQWRAKEIETLARTLQPGIVINDRLPSVGDYETPEQFIPPKPPEGAWETCMTMNESWGFNPRDTRYKSPRAVVHALCEVAGKNGNLLLNISPTGEGEIPPEQIERLDVLARWMGKHSEAILGTEPGLEPWQFYGPSTRKGSRVFLHVLMRPYESVTVRGVPVRRLKSVVALGTGEELKKHARIAIPDRLANPDPMGELTIRVPESAIDEYATVIALEFAEKA